MATTELGEDPTVPSVLGRLGPNWFASVMGTGIVAVVAYVCLLGTWILVAVRTARGSLHGNLFQPPSTVPVKAHKDPVT
jgi:hypothetical protein